MILQKIKLQNIRSYSSQDIKFPKGSTLLSGDIGSGKSTILMALEFGLFGLSKGQLTGSMLLRNGTQNASVEIQFRLDDKDYTIKRSLKKQNDKIQQTPGFILENDTKKDMTALELKAYMMDLLGYPQESINKKSYIYRYTLYTPQEEMKSILYEDKDERLDTLRKIFNIDKYKQIRENSVIFTRSLKEKKRLLQGKTEDLPKKEEEKIELSKEYGIINSKINQLTPDIQQSNINITKSKTNIEKIEEDMKNLTELKKNFALKDQILKEKIMQVSKNNKELKETIEAIEKIKDSLKDLDVEKPKESEGFIENKIKESEIKIEEENKISIESKEKLNNFNQRLQEYEEKIKKNTISEKDLEKKRSEQKDLVESIKRKYDFNNNLVFEEEKLKDILNRLNEASIHKKQSEKLKDRIKIIDNCPTCLQSVTKDHKDTIITEENKKLEKYETELAKFEEMKKKEEFLIQNFKTNIEDLQKKEILLEKIKAEIERSESKIKEINEYKIIIEEINKKKLELKNVNYEGLNRLKDDLDKNKLILKKIQKINQVLKEKELNQRLMIEKQDSLTNLTDTQQDLKKDVGSINKDKLELNKQIEQFEKIEKEYQEEKDNLEILNNKDKELQIYSTKLTTERENLEKNIERLNEEIKSKKDDRLRLKEINKLILWINDYFIELTTTIEKHIMGTIYREFNQILQNWFNIMIEDENLNIKLNDSFAPMIEQDGYESDIQNLSGGEKTSAALAYRLALNKTINDVIGTIKTKDLIILDEPTDGFSSEQLDKMRIVLEELDARQAIIVSHDSKIESFVDHIIHIGKDEHQSRIIS